MSDVWVKHFVYSSFLWVKSIKPDLFDLSVDLWRLNRLCCFPPFADWFVFWVTVWTHVFYLKEQFVKTVEMWSHISRFSVSPCDVIGGDTFGEREAGANPSGAEQRLTKAVWGVDGWAGTLLHHRSWKQRREKDFCYDKTMERKRRQEEQLVIITSLNETLQFGDNLTR